MKKLLLTLLMAGTGILAVAQHKPQYSQYMINNFLINPAIAGIEDYADVRAGYRNQWVGIEGAPSTYYVTAHMPLGKDINVADPRPAKTGRQKFDRYQKENRKYKTVRPHHGIGAMVMVDKIGPFSMTEAYLVYSYHVLLTKEIKLSAGLTAGMMQYMLNTSELSLATPDAAIDGSIMRSVKPDITGGMWLYSSDFYAGVSAAQLLGNTFSFGGDELTNEARMHKHYFVTGGYKITPMERLALIPSVLVKWVNPAPPAIDVSLRANYAQRIWGGASWRQSEGMVYFAGVTLNPMFDLGYSFDPGIRGIARRGNGSHEITLGMRLRNRYQVSCPQNMW
jgi:type IX secretion system PorP/SprF family membrane protein